MWRVTIGLCNWEFLLGRQGLSPEQPQQTIILETSKDTSACSAWLYTTYQFTAIKREELQFYFYTYSGSQTFALLAKPYTKPTGHHTLALSARALTITNAYHTIFTVSGPNIHGSRRFGLGRVAHRRKRTVR